MRRKLLEHYERELGYLRQLGAEFAAKYPAVAGHLLLEPDRCGDPHVERLLEAFSFLAARIHLRLDDDLPELTQGFLDVVYPHYLRPIPSMTVVEFSLDQVSNNAAGTISVPAGSELIARRTKDGTPCRFRTGYPVSLWPVKVVQCAWRRPEQIASAPRVPEATAVLRVELRAERDVAMTQLRLDSLVLYLSGERSITLPLYELLSRNLLQVMVRNPLRQDRSAITVTKTLRPMGFAAEESLLPYTQRSFQGHRLLQEYFSFQEKFLFFELKGLKAAIEAVEATDGLELLFYVRQFDQPERMQTLEVGVSAETVRLHCTPVINLFEHTAEPVVVTQTRYEYPVSVSARNRAGTEIFSIDSVLATNPSRRSSINLPSLFEHRFGAPQSLSPVFWKSTRKYSEVHAGRPSDMYLSIVDAHGLMMEPNAEVLTVKCTCTNHHLPSKLPFGDAEGDFYLQGAAGLGRIRALHRPTLTYAAPVAEVQAWSLISQLSLNHLSMGEAGLSALQEILRLHNFTEAPHFDKQIRGIVGLHAKRHIALMQGEFGSAAVRGMRVEMEFDESHFPGGGAYLFGAVLDRFLGLYVSMNSFSQLAVRTNARKEMLGEWPPRAGKQTLM